MKISNRLTIKAFYFAVLVSLLIFNSCSKDGADGVNGKDGLQGEQGIPGIDGATLLSGSGAPTTTLGKNGDFYLDKSSIQIYGPKSSSGWGNPTSLKGTDGKDGKDGSNGKDGVDGTNGKDGKDGSKILSGNQIPTEKDGSIGDFYFDTQNMAIYGPKTSSGWGSPISLKAPSSSDVTVLLYKNHSFQKIVEDIERTTQNLEYIESIKSYIEDLNDDKKVAENQISIEKKNYDDRVSYINSNVLEAERQSWLEEALQVFNSNTAYYREKLINIEEKLLLQTDLLNKATSAKFYEFESNIPIAITYQNVYDNGLIIVQLRKSNDSTSNWDDKMSFENSYDSFFNTYNPIIFKDKINLSGFSSGQYTESEIQATKIDVKVVFIPATNVIEMKAKNIDTKNVEAVVKHLNL